MDLDKFGATEAGHVEELVEHVRGRPGHSGEAFAQATVGLHVGGQQAPVGIDHEYVGRLMVGHRGQRSQSKRVAETAQAQDAPRRRSQHPREEHQDTHLLIANYDHSTLGNGQIMLENPPYLAG
jgi:hypothetical protein